MSPKQPKSIFINPPKNIFVSEEEQEETTLPELPTAEETPVEPAASPERLPPRDPNKLNPLQDYSTLKLDLPDIPPIDPSNRLNPSQDYSALGARHSRSLKELKESDDSDWDQRMVASFRESWDTRKQLISAWDEVFAIPGLIAPTRGLFLDKMIKGEDEPLRIGFPNARDMVQLLGEAQIALGLDGDNILLSGAPLEMILPLAARTNRALGGGDFFGDETPMWDTAVQFYRERYDFTQPGWAEAFGEVLATDVAGVIGDFAAAASLAGLTARGASVASKAAARASRQLGIKMDGRLAKAGWVSEKLASKAEKFGELAEGFNRRVNQSMVSPKQLFNLAKAPRVLRALGRFGRRWGAADMELATLPFVAAAELWRMKLKRAGEAPVDVGLQDLMLSQRKLEGVEMQMMANVEHGQVINQAASDLGGVRGVSQPLRSADGKLQYDSEYMVVELDQLQPSHTLGGQVNPEHSPNVRLQPRDRTLQASRDQITSIAQDLDPEILLSPGHMLDTGTPIIGLSGRVESGNGRVLAMMQAQSEGLSGWESYQQALREKAEQFGIDPSSLEGMQSPVVVRARTSILSDTELNQFTKVSNEPTTARYSATEAADTDVEILTDEVMNLFEPTSARTLREMLGQTSNRAFIDRFVEGIPFTERLGLIDDNGKLTDQGLQRLEDTMLRRVFPSESGKQMTRVFIETRDEMLKNIHDAIRSALPQLIEAESLVQAGHRASDLMISEDLANAVVMYNRLHQEGTSPADFFAQQTFDFGAGSMEMTPATRRILEFFGENLNKPRVLREFVQGYADAVIASDNPSQALIGVVDTTTKEQILNSVIGESELETPTLNNIETTVAEAGEQIEQARDTVDIDANTTEYSNRMIEILEGLGRNIDEQGQRVIEQAIQEARGTGQVSDESLFQIGRLGESLTVEVVDAIRQAFESEGRPTEWLDNLSIHAYGDIQRGLDESARLGEVDPDSAFPPVHQAYSYERLQQWDDMEQAARQAVEKDSTDVYAQAALGRALTHKGQFDEAIEVFDNLITNNPDDAYAHISRAETKRKMSQDEPPQTQAHNRLNRPDLALSLEDAISEIGELLDSVVIDTEINRLDDNVLQVKYKTFTVEGTPVDRTVEIRGRYVGDQTVIDTFSDGSTVEFLQEDALSLKGAMGDSNIPTDISNPDIFAAVSGEMRTRQGTIRYKQENPSPVNTRQRLGQEADADIERAEEIQFGDPSEDTMSLEEARTEFGEKVEGETRDLTAEGATFRGLNHFKAGRYSQAIARAEEAVRLDPNNALAHGILGYSYYGKGRASRRTGNMEESNTFFEDAANSFRKALEIEPDNVYSLNGMAWYHYRKGQHSQARYYREQARLAESGERMAGRGVAEIESELAEVRSTLQDLENRVTALEDSPDVEQLRAQADNLESELAEARSRESGEIDDAESDRADTEDALTLLDEAEITIELNDEGQKVARYQGLDEDGNPHEVTATFDANMPDDEVRQRTQELIDAEKEGYQQVLDEGEQAPEQRVQDAEAQVEQTGNEVAESEVALREHRQQMENRADAERGMQAGDALGEAEELGERLQQFANGLRADVIQIRRGGDEVDLQAVQAQLPELRDIVNRVVNRLTEVEADLPGWVMEDVADIRSEITEALSLVERTATDSEFGNLLNSVDDLLARMEERGGQRTETDRQPEASAEDLAREQELTANLEEVRQRHEDALTQDSEARQAMGEARESAMSPEERQLVNRLNELEQEFYRLERAGEDTEAINTETEQVQQSLVDLRNTDDDIPFGEDDTTRTPDTEEPPDAETVRQPSQLPLNQVEEFYQFLLDKAKDVDDPMLNKYVQALDGLTEDIVQGLAEIDPRIEGITDAFEDAKQIVGNKATFDYLDFIRNTLGNDVTDAPRYSNVVNQLMENIDSPENVQRILEQLSENDIDRFRGVVLQNMWERWADGGADDLAKLNENGQLEALLGTGIANSIRMWDEIVEDYIRPDPRPETAPDRPPEPETVADENLPRTPEGELPRKPEDILPEDKLLPHEERAEHRLNIKRRRKAIVEAARSRIIEMLASIRNSFVYRASLGISAGIVGLGAYQGAGWLIAGGAFALVNAAALEAIVYIADKRNLRKSIREGVPHVEDAIQRGKGEPAIINLLDMLLNDAKRQNILPSLRILKESSQIREDDEQLDAPAFGEFAR